MARVRRVTIYIPIGRVGGSPADGSALQHQTAVESMLLTDMFVAWSGLPMTTVTRTEHAASWMGRMTDFLWRQPGRSVAVNPQLLFAREQPQAFLDLMAAYSAAQAGTPHSLHLHVEGEQATSSRQRVQRMSAVVIDLALELQLPVLPLRFSGGLPLEPLPEICSFPVDFGRQDYTVGRPLLPEELRRMPRPKAAELVVAAINAIAVTDEALPGVPGRSAALAAFCAQHGVTEIQAAVILALRTLAAPSASTRSTSSSSSSGSRAGRSILFRKVKTGKRRRRHTSNNLRVCGSTPFAASSTMTALSAAIRVR